VSTFNASVKHYDDAKSMIRRWTPVT